MADLLKVIRATQRLQRIKTQADIEALATADLIDILESLPKYVVTQSMLTMIEMCGDELLMKIERTIKKERAKPVVDGEYIASLEQLRHYIARLKKP